MDAVRGRIGAGKRVRARAGIAMVAIAILVVQSNASAAISKVLAGKTMDGEPLSCAAEADGVRVCVGDLGSPGSPDLRLRSFDGTPLALFVTLPPATVSGNDGGYPLVVQSHGWGAPPSGPDDTQYGGPSARQWALKGYAVLQFAARGWGNSCGSLTSRLASPLACANGYIHLDDYRYEGRDVQHAVGLLVDEGLVDPERVGLSGESYGAGVSLGLATLRDRVMNENGSLSPWTSPAGRPLRIAAAAPFAGWSDLVYALRPNGRTLDSEITSATDNLSVAGVEKFSVITGLFLVGAQSGHYPLPATNPQADLLLWYLLNTAGEPYASPLDRSMVRNIAQFHSPYYLLAGAYGVEQRPPAPLLLANGFTDDVFPGHEVLRYYRLARTLYPSNPISLFLGDVGHQRANSKAADLALMNARIEAFFDHYVKGTGPRPALDVTVLTQTCPNSVPSEGPYSADTWEALQPGEVVYRSQEARTILSVGGNPVVGQQLDPVFGGLACTTVPAQDQGLGVATYRLPAATGAGYTLLGSPTVSADMKATGLFAYIAARLLDVDPATDTQTLVARGVYRIDPEAPQGRIVFQLNPNAWRFAPGHVPKLELLGQDAPYTRPANGVFSISVSNLELRLPVHDIPGASGTPPEVRAPENGAEPARKARFGGVLGWLALLPLLGFAAWRGCSR